MADLGEKFWSNVVKTEGCWLWTGPTNPKGYGRFWNGNAKVYPHRFAYELLVGPIPEGRQLDHRTTCSKCCVNPEHLRPVTNKQNCENLSGAQSNNRGSGVRGVYWSAKEKKWAAKAVHNGKQCHGGFFVTIAEADIVAIALRNRLFTHNDADRGVVHGLG